MIMNCTMDNSLSGSLLRIMTANLFCMTIFLLSKANATSVSHVISVVIPISDPLPPQYFIRAVSDKWIGSETVLPVIFRNLILPGKFSPPTALLDLQPLLLSEIAAEELIALWEGLVSFLDILPKLSA